MLYLILANLCLAFAIVSSKVALQFISPVVFIVLRMGIPGISFLILNLCSGKIKLMNKNLLAIKSLFFMICVTSITPLLLKYFVLQKICSAKFAFLGGMDAFVAAFWMYFFFGEKLKIQQFFSVFLAFFAIAISSIDLSSCGQILWQFSTMDLLMILAVFLSKLGWIIAKELVARKFFLADELTILNTSGTAIFLFVGSIFFLDWKNALMPMLKIKPLFSLLVASYSYFFGYFFFTRCLERYHFTLISISGSSIPFFVGVINYFMGEHISKFLFLGIFINLAAIKLFTDSARQRKTAVDLNVVNENSLGADLGLPKA